MVRTPACQAYHGVNHAGWLAMLYFVQSPHRYGHMMTATVRALFIKPAHGQPMQSCQELTLVTGSGIIQDVNAGSRRRQVLLIDIETLASYGLQPGQVRENITTQGIHLGDLPPGGRLQIGEAELELSGHCAPCDFIESLRAGLRAELEGRRGMLAVVSRGGLVQIDAVISLVSEPRA
jgi:hypothetical protein